MLLLIAAIACLRRAVIGRSSQELYAGGCHALQLMIPEVLNA